MVRGGLMGETVKIHRQLGETGGDLREYNMQGQQHLGNHISITM